jgi:hypothetical protein
MVDKLLIKGKNHKTLIYKQIVSYQYCFLRGMKNRQSVLEKFWIFKEKRCLRVSFFGSYVFPARICLLTKIDMSRLVRRGMFNFVVNFLLGINFEAMGPKSGTMYLLIRNQMLKSTNNRRKYAS